MSETDYLENQVKLEGDLVLLERSTELLEARRSDFGNFPIWACDDIKKVIYRLSELIKERKE